MALWKTQPALRLYVQQPVRVGEDLNVRLEIEATEPVPVEWVSLTLTAVEGWSVGSGKNRVARSHRYPDLTARLVGETELSGTSNHLATFSIPASQPPSRHASTAYVRYAFKAQASIPWWPDARASWPLEVRAPGVSAGPLPVVVHEGASDLLAISLESQRVAVGGVVGGLIALKRPVERPLVVDVTLREVLRLVSWNGHERVRYGRGFTTSVQVSSAVGQAPFRFTFADATPSFSAQTFSQGWELLVAPRAEGFFAAVADALSRNGIHIPIEMVESEQLARLSERLIAPNVGEARIAELLTAAARARPVWGADGLALERTVASAFGPIDARIEWVAREEGTYLRASVEPPRLGLGLRVSRAAMLDRLVGDVVVGVGEWDARHKVEARTAAQAAPFLAPLALASGSLAMSATDDLIELERRDDAVSLATLTAFLDEIEGVLGVLPDALAAIPPPAGTSVDRTEAARLARLAHGSFHPGDLALRGAIDEHPFEATLLFDGERAVALRVAVEGVTRGALHVGPSRDAESLRHVPPEARPIVGALPPGSTISIDAGRAQAMIPPPGTPIFGVDHARSLAIAQTLVALARSLSPDRGPFR